MLPCQILDKHTIIDMISLKCISHHISHLSLHLQYCSEKSILANQINNSIYTSTHKDYNETKYL